VSVSGGSVVDTGTITAASYTQTLGTTTVSGTLDASGVNVSGGSVFGVGTITGNIDLTGGLLSAGATCFDSRFLASESCGVGSVAKVANGGEIHVASGGGEVHNNIMVATRSMSVARGGVSHESSASAAVMARLYVCAYLPFSVAHAMGCN
jgi:hypothetical protein